jgi:hypothetical protein
MTAQVTINPLQTSVAAGTFNISSSGVIQGTAFNDPAVRNQLAGGTLKSSETIPMWGGVAISENIPGVTPGPEESLGPLVTRATNVTANTAGTVTGFSVFDQNWAAINSPQSPVPLTPSGGLVNFYSLGSLARIAVKCDPALVSLEGGVVTQQVSWDFGNQQLVPFNAAWAANVITAATWAATAGGQVTFTTTSAHGVAVGEWFTISGMVPVGYNGTYKAITGTAGSTLVAANTTNPGASTTQGTLVAGGGALPIREVKAIHASNCMTVVFDPVTGFATWNRNDACAIIQL